MANKRYNVYSGSRALSGYYPGDIPGVFAFRRNDRISFENKEDGEQFIKRVNKEVNQKDNQERYGKYAKKHSSTAKNLYVGESDW